MAQNNNSVGTISLNLALNSNNFNNQLKNIGSQTKGLSSTFSGLGKAITAAFSVDAIRKFSSAFQEAEQGAMKLYATLSGQGMNLDTADNFISKYVEDGLVSLKEAQTAYANLAAMGMDNSQIKNIMNTLKDSASVARASGKSIGEAVEQAAAGIKQGISNNVDNAGIDTNLAKMEDAYRRMYGIVGDLTQEQKNAAYEMGILQEGAKYFGSAEKIASRYGGTIAKLSASFNQLKVNLGSILSHVLQPLFQMLTLVIYKINEVASSFANMLNTITGTTNIKDMFTSTASEMGKEVASATEEIGSAGTSAATKIARALMPFDKLNRLTSSSSGGSSSGTSTSKTPTGTTQEANETETIIDKTNKKLSQLEQNLGRIKKSLSNIFGSEEVKTAMNNYTNSLVEYSKSLGSMYLGVGESLGTWITGGIATALENNEESIQKWFLDILKYTTNINTSLTEFNRAIEDIFTVFEDEEMSTTLSHAIEIIGNVVGTTTGIMVRAASDFIELFTTPVIDNVDKIKKALKGTFTTMDIELSFFSEKSAEYGEKFTTLYDEHIGPVLDKLTESFSSCFSILLDIYNEYFLPIIQGLSGDTTKAIKDDILPSIDSLIKGVGDACDFIVSIWDEGIHPLLEVLTTIVGMAAANIVIAIKTISTAFGWLASPITTAMKFMNDFKDAGEEMGNALKKVGEGISDVFSSIAGTIKNAINGVITCINNMIDSINTLNIDIPNPFGEDKHIGFNIPHIPMLANGGYVGPNNPQLAVIGDNPRYGEVVANDKQLNDLGNRIVNGVIQGISNVGGNQPIYLAVQIGEDDITDIVATSMNRYNRQTGKRIF